MHYIMLWILVFGMFCIPSLFHAGLPALSPPVLMLVEDELVLASQTPAGGTAWTGELSEFTGPYHALFYCSEFPNLGHAQFNLHQWNARLWYR